jgi:hypothetical protein
MVETGWFQAVGLTGIQRVQVSPYCVAQRAEVPPLGVLRLYLLHVLAVL